MGKLFRGKKKDPSCHCPASNTRQTKNKTTRTDMSDGKQSKNEPVTKKSNQTNLKSSQSLMTDVEIMNNVNNHKKSNVELSATDDCSTSTSVLTDSNASSPARGIQENVIISKKTGGDRLTKNKTDPKNTTILNFDSANDEKKEAISRPVLCDKTNSVVKNNFLQSSQKAKLKVHFSSVNNVNRITQRRISDFFHTEEHHHKMKELPEWRSPGKNKKNKNDISVLNESIEKLDKSVNQKINEKRACNGADLSKTILPDHIPVYKLPVVNGRESFRLTPPQVKNKEALYEFEVDENEEPRGKKKKRRPVKTYRKRKRPCLVNNVYKSNELNDVPQRTIILRNDPQVSKNCESVTIEEVIEINALDSEIEQSNHQIHVDTHSNTKKATSQSKSFDRCNLSGVKSNSNYLNKSVCGNPSVREHGDTYCPPPVDLDELNAKQNEHCNYIHDTTIVSGVRQSSRVHSSTVISNTSGNRHTASHSRSNASSHCINSDALINSAVQNQEFVSLNNPMDSNKPINDASNCTYSSSHSPLPECSRLGESIQVGPIYSSNSNGINCSDTEFNNTFLRGITASTPFRTHHSPIEKNYCPVRLSGGEASNRFHNQISMDSDSDEEDFFGFRVNENHDDSINNIDMNKTPQKTMESSKNEPELKISIKEVIDLLKKNVGKDRRQDIKKVKPSTGVFNSSSLLSPVSDKSEESYIGSSDLSSYHDKSQPNIDKYVTKDKRKNFSCVEEPDSSFSKPPRRSYSITPRKKLFVNYQELNGDNEGNSDDETDVKKKPVRKIRKDQPSKKQAKEMEKLAAMMNSQFQEVDKFELVVEYN